MQEENQIQINKNSLEKQIEAILFWKGEPISIKKLSQILEKKEEEIQTGENFMLAFSLV